MATTLSAYVCRRRSSRGRSVTSPSKATATFTGMPARAAASTYPRSSRSTMFVGGDAYPGYTSSSSRKCVGPSPCASAPPGRASASSMAASSAPATRIGLLQAQQVPRAVLGDPQRTARIVARIFGRGPRDDRPDAAVALDDVVGEPAAARRAHVREEVPEADHIRVRAGTRCGGGGAGVEARAALHVPRLGPRRGAIAEVPLERVDAVDPAVEREDLLAVGTRPRPRLGERDGRGSRRGGDAVGVLDVVGDEPLPVVLDEALGVPEDVGVRRERTRGPVGVHVVRVDLEEHVPRVRVGGEEVELVGVAELGVVRIVEVLPPRALGVEEELDALLLEQHLAELVERLRGAEPGVAQIRQGLVVDRIHGGADHPVTEVVRELDLVAPVEVGVVHDGEVHAARVAADGLHPRVVEELADRLVRRRPTDVTDRELVLREVEELEAGDAEGPEVGEDLLEAAGQ